MVVSGRIELPTHGFSVRCSTDWATKPWRSWRESNSRSPLWQRGMLITTPQDQKWLREMDLNHRPSDYEPDELPSCSIPRYTHINYNIIINMIFKNGGRWGIRTPAWVSPPFGFQDRSLQPGLGNLPFNGASSRTRTCNRPIMSRGL